MSVIRKFKIIGSVPPELSCEVRIRGTLVHAYRNKEDGMHPEELSLPMDNDVIPGDVLFYSRDFFSRWLSPNFVSRFVDEWPAPDKTVVIHLSGHQSVDLPPGAVAY